MLTINMASKLFFLWMGLNMDGYKTILMCVRIDLDFFCMGTSSEVHVYLEGIKSVI